MRGLVISLLLVLAGCIPAPHAPPSRPSFSLPAAATSTLRVVSVSGGSGGDISSGSGVAVARNFVLTNRHVIANALADGLNFEVYVFDNSAGFPRRANAIIAQDPRLDLAILYVRGITSTPATLALAPPSQLETVTALGFPAATDEVFNRLHNTVSTTSGQVTALDRGPVGEFGPISLLMHTATVNPGNSGGPLFNSCGQLAGINTLRGNPSEASNVFVASSVSEITPFLLSYGVNIEVADNVCASDTSSASTCTFDRTALDSAIAGSDLDALEEAISAIPPTCPELMSDGWRRRHELVTALNDAFLQMAGTWRLTEASCGDAIWVIQSGVSMVGFSGSQTQVERFARFADGAITTRTIHPEGPGSYRYSLIDGRLKIENLTNNQTWELERCTG